MYSRTTTVPIRHSTLAGAEAARCTALRAGDERAFADLMRIHGPSMLRVAELYVRSRAVAEEVVQEAWLGVLTGIERFEGRSSLKTWIFRILTNIAKTRASRERRSVPFSALARDERAGPAVDPARFLGPEDRWAGHWAASPRSPAGVPEERLLADELCSRIDTAIGCLPDGQRAVVTLRDVSGFDPSETCSLLGISEVNQRVLLHRARSKLRAVLEEYLDEHGSGSPES